MRSQDQISAAPPSKARCQHLDSFLNCQTLQGFISMSDCLSVQFDNEMEAHNDSTKITIFCVLLLVSPQA